MVKSASLASKTVEVEKEAEPTRIRAWTVAAPLAIQVKLPSLAVEELSVDQVSPPLRDNRIFTELMVPMEVQVMVCACPNAHTSPPLGLVTVIVGPSITKSPSLMSETAALVVELTRMRAWLVAGVLATHEYWPSFAVELTIVAHMPPPSRDISILT